MRAWHALIIHKRYQTIVIDRHFYMQYHSEVLRRYLNECVERLFRVEEGHLRGVGRQCVEFANLGRAEVARHKT